MHKTENVILTNMCMVYDQDNVLVIDRYDDKWPGVCFPGGHINKKESFVDSTIREIYEETGLVISNLKLCGIKQWTDKSNKFRYVVILYKTNTFKGSIRDSNEGKIFWIDKKDIDNYKLAEGFKEMFEVFDRDELSENYWFLENDEWKISNK